MDKKQKMIEFVKTRIQENRISLKLLEAKKGNSYAVWAAYHLSGVIMSEKLIEYWNEILTYLQSPMCEENCTIEEGLVKYFNKSISDLAFSSIPDSTNHFRSEVEKISHEAFQEFIGNKMSTNSLRFALRSIYGIEL